MPEAPDFNEQMSDILGNMKNMFLNEGVNDFRAVSYQLMVHAAGLAMFNSVFQQQQSYILKNAVTTATAKSILESKPEEAIKLFNEANRNNDILSTLNVFKEFIDGLNESYNDLNKKSQPSKAGKEPIQNDIKNSEEKS